MTLHLSFGVNYPWSQHLKSFPLPSPTELFVSHVTLAFGGCIPSTNSLKLFVTRVSRLRWPRHVVNSPFIEGKETGVVVAGSRLDKERVPGRGVLKDATGGHKYLRRGGVVVL